MFSSAKAVRHAMGVRFVHLSLGHSWAHCGVAVAHSLGLEVALYHS
jgi:hypothetical protein